MVRSDDPAHRTADLASRHCAALGAERRRGGYRGHGSTFGLRSLKGNEGATGITHSTILLLSWRRAEHGPGMRRARGGESGRARVPEPLGSQGAAPFFRWRDLSAFRVSGNRKPRTITITLMHLEAIVIYRKHHAS